MALIGLIVVVAAGFLVKNLTGHHSTPGKAGSSVSQSVAANGKYAVKPLSALPPEAKQTWALIQHNGPFPNRQDGVVFENRESRLPSEPSGYYHEYTVATPGSADRGTRRLITGHAKELYYTDDHYGSFASVDPSK